MERMLIKGLKILLVIFISGHLYANPYIYNPYSSDIYVIQRPNTIYADPRDIKLPENNFMESFQKGQEMSAKISQQQQQNILNRILANNTNSMGEIDLENALKDARKESYSSQNVNIIAQMLREKKSEDTQVIMNKERLDAEIRLDNAKREADLVTKNSIPPVMNSLTGKEIENLSKQGYAVYEETRIKDGKFNGCKQGSIYTFTNGSKFKCEEYNYHYAYDPEVFILKHIKKSDFKVLIDDVVFDGTLD